MSERKVMNEKLITFAIPCYNSAAYMRKCIESLLTAGDDCEIIIVNDGSTKDNTAEIADEYAAKYPDICVAHHQENGGHGEGVNQGLRLARGLYYKVVDSDDWLDETCLAKLMDKIRELHAAGTDPDLLVSNYVYEHADGPGHTMRYKNVFPLEKICGWDDIHHQRTTQYFMMHSFIYRTAVMRESGIVLPKHTFYVDNLFIYVPLPYVKTIYYMDLDLYRYFIGRDDQSVNVSNLIKRIDQHVRVVHAMIDSHDMRAVKAQSRKLYQAMYHHLSMMMTIASVFLYMNNTPESLKMNKEIWEHLKKKDRRLYRRMHYLAVSGLTTLPGAPGRKITVLGYKIVNKILRLNSQ